MIKNYLFAAFKHHKINQKETEGVIYILSKRGTEHVLFEGNTYTPNEKSINDQGIRTWKCSKYFKLKCKSRVTTRRIGSKEYIRPSIHEHNHPDEHPSTIKIDINKIKNQN